MGDFFEWITPEDGIFLQTDLMINKVTPEYIPFL